MLDPRPVVGRGNRRSESEQIFHDWLIEHGYEVVGWESIDLHLGKTNWLRPDFLLSSGVYLEHTDADVMVHAWMLSAEIRQQNRTKSSGKAFLPPLHFLERKRRRIRRAERLNHVTIVLLPATVRQQIFQRPELLEELIELRQTSPAAYDKYLDRQLKELEKLPA